MFKVTREETGMIIDEILAIRERWHTKNHAFFRAFAEGKLPLRAMGVYKAMHWMFVQHGLASFGILYARTIAHEVVRMAIGEQISGGLARGRVLHRARRSGRRAQSASGDALRQVSR